MPVARTPTGRFALLVIALMVAVALPRVAANQQPVAKNITVSVLEDQSIAVTLAGSDADGEPLTYQASTPTPDGTLTFAAPASVTFTPAPQLCDGYGQTHQFTYTANDGTGSANAQSAPATVTVKVVCVDDPPTFTPGGPVTGSYWTGPAPSISSVVDWATRVNPGPQEAEQDVRFLMSHTLLPNGQDLFDPSLQGVAPYIVDTSGHFTGVSDTAPLYFRPAMGRMGVSTVTACLQDNGIVSGKWPGAGDQPGTPGRDIGTCSTFTVSIHGPPTAFNDGPYLVYNDQVFSSSVATSVLANDVNFDGQRPPQIRVTTYPSWDEPGGLQMNGDGSFVYTPKNGEPVAPSHDRYDTFWYQAGDGFNDWSQPAQVTLDIHHISQPYALFSYQPASVAAGEAVLFTDGSYGTDAPLVGWHWEFADGGSSSNPNPAHRFAQSGDYPVTLVVTNEGGLTDTVTHVVHVGPAPSGAGSTTRAPSADAGMDENVTSGDAVRLVGTGSPEGGIVAWSWTELAGPPVALLGVHDSVLRFTAPAVPPRSETDLVFSLVAYDGSSDSASSQVTVHVHPANVAPVPDAGPGLTGIAGSQVLLNGSATFDPDGDPLTYRWTQVAGPPAAVRGVSAP
ncbi:MAG: PKD domain-containing protein, partial [Thermoplasmatota archaeon]